MTPEEEYKYIQTASLEALVEKKGRSMTQYEIANKVCTTDSKLEVNYVMTVLDDVLEEYYEHGVVRKDFRLKDSEKRLKKRWQSNIHYL